MRYKAFISYSHAADGKLAPAIQRALHRIAKPWYRLRTMRVFRDQTNLATSPGLWTSIESALCESEFFVYLASPNAAQSPWVQKEVSWWLKNRTHQSFLILLTDGEIAWDNANQDLDWTLTTAMPRQVSKAFGEEPLYTDLRWARTVDQLSSRHAQFRTALLDLAATLLNRAKDEIDGDDIRQYRRTIRIAWFSVIALSVLLGAALLAAYFATQQSMLATARSLSAQSEAVLATNPELALLLAREALKYKTDDQAEFALRQAFVRNPLRMIHHSPTGRNIVAKFVGSNTLVIAEQGKPASVWDVATGQRVAELPNTTEVAYELRLGESIDSSVVAIPYPDETGFTVYDAKTWKPLGPLPGVNVRVSRDGKVMTAATGNRIRQWSLPSLKERTVKASLPERYVVRDVNAEANLLLLTEQDAEFTQALIVDAISGNILSKIPERLFRDGTGFTPDGRFVVTQRTDEKGLFELWDAQLGSLVRTFEEPFSVGWITYVAFDPDSKMFVAGDRGGELKAWNIETGERVAMLGVQRNDINWIKFSPDGATMLSVASDGTACLWDAVTMRCLVTLGGKGDEAFDVAFAADSRHFLTTHRDGTVRVWDRQTWQPMQTFRAANTVLSEDGTSVLGTTETGLVTISDTANGQVKATLLQTPPDIQQLALDRSNSLVAIAPTEALVGLWNAHTGLPTIKLAQSTADTTALAFDPTSKQLATGSKNGIVRFWNTSDGKLLDEWQVGNDEVHGITFHPDGERVIVAVNLWGRVNEKKSGAVALQMQLDEEAPVEGLALNADGSLLIITGDVSPQIWDLNSYNRVQTLEGHSDEVYCAAFSTDGRWFLTGSGFKHNRGLRPEDGSSVFVWDAKTGREFLSYRSAERSVEAVSFGNDGKTILAADLDGIVRRYECEACLRLPALLDLVSAKISRELSPDERARYVSDSTLLGWLMRRLAS